MPRGETLQVPIDRPAGPAKFDLVLPWPLAGDQPKAAEALSGGISHGLKQQTLHGVTGSGKTVTMAKVIADAGRPTLVLAHNKTLAAQLYGEFKELFPGAAVLYFVSYYDYYQPEAYVPSTDTFIEKDSIVNVLPEPVIPSSTCASSPRARPWASSAIALGWSPAG